MIRGHEGKGEEGGRLAVFTTHISLRRLISQTARGNQAYLYNAPQSESLARTVVQMFHPGLVPPPK